jgi:hypothetical protein
MGEFLDSQTRFLILMAVQIIMLAHNTVGLIYQSCSYACSFSCFKNSVISNFLINYEVDLRTKIEHLHVLIWERHQGCN